MLLVRDSLRGGFLSALRHLRSPELVCHWTVQLEALHFRSPADSLTHNLTSRLSHRLSYDRHADGLAHGLTDRTSHAARNCIGYPHAHPPFRSYTAGSPRPSM